jgi:5-methyltetrahydrofolate corrinoid/iron sulfur protein methyltransferase
MILIGESINVMSKTIGTAIKERDKKPIQDLALKQVEAGAHMLDLNIGPARKEGAEVMEWVVKVVQEVVDVPLSLDTTNPVAMEAGLKVVKQRPLINSVSAQKERLERMLPLAKKYDTPFVALLLSDSGIPRDQDERASVALDIILKANELGVKNEDIWVDPILMPVSVDQRQVVEFIDFLKILPELSPGIKSTCGLSNVSNGSPKELRGIINRTFYLMIMNEGGMHSAIVDTLDEDFMRTVCKVEELKGKGGNLLDYFKEQEVVKTLRVLRNEVLYSHSFLEV